MRFLSTTGRNTPSGPAPPAASSDWATASKSRWPKWTPLKNRSTSASPLGPPERKRVVSPETRDSNAEVRKKSEPLTGGNRVNGESERGGCKCQMTNDELSP